MPTSPPPAHPTDAPSPAPAPARPSGARPPSDAGRAGWAAGLLLAIAGLMVVDVVEDVHGAAERGHLIREALVLLLSVGGAGVLLLRTRRAERRATGLASDLVRARADASRWRIEAEAALSGLSVAIDAQFGRWGLTPAEKEVGLLLLKGLSLKEVAELRGGSERTARQQATAVYRKAGVAGRAELSAFFLEDLLLPAANDRATGASP